MPIMPMIDQEIINRVIQQESGGNPNAVSPAGAQGIMQIMPDTARDPGYGVKPLQGWDGVNPMTAPVEEQVRFGTDYLNAMAQQHGGDTRLALAAYNAGPGAVAAAGNQVPNFKETQDYVNKIAPNTGATQVAQNDWRSRAQPIAAQEAQPVAAAPAVQDWRSRAQPLQNSVAPSAKLEQAPAQPVSDWRSRASPTNTELQGNDSGAGVAALQGFNSAVPFGQRIVAGLGAAGAKGYDAVTGGDLFGDKTKGLNPEFAAKLKAENPEMFDARGLGSVYAEGRQDQIKTDAEHPVANALGSVAGIAASLPLISTKVLTGTRATTGARGAVNAIPEALGAVGNFVRGSKVAEGAGAVAKGANLAGQAIRSAAVAAPAGAAYAYGNSQNDLNSKAAVDDAITGAKFSAALGAATPLAGAALSKIPKPNVSQAVKDLAATAKNKFGIDLSIDQIAPSKVRDTVQKISQNIPGSGVDAFQEKQTTQWMRGVAKTLGEDADNLAPEVIQKYLKRAGTDFESALANKTITFEQKDINALADVAAMAKRKVSTGLADVVQNNVDDVLDNLSKFSVKNGGRRDVPGEKLASLRSQLLADLPSIEGGARQQVAKIIDKIDEVVDRALSPAEVKKLANARLQWRNFRTLEPLLEKSPDGMINPTQLMQKVASSKYIKASRKKVGEDDLVDLARIGKQFLPKKGGSDTAQKLIGAGAVGSLGTLALTNPPAALAIAAKLAVGAGANRGYQKLVNQSPNVVKNLVTGNKAASKAPAIAALLGAQVAPVKITKAP